MSIDPITEDFVDISTYQFAHNNPVWKVELEGLEGIPFQVLINADAAAHPNGVGAHLNGFTQGLVNSAKGLYNAVTSPMQTAKGIGNTALAGLAHVASTTSEGGTINAMRIDNALGTNATGAYIGLGNSIENGINTLVNGNGIERGNVLGELTGAALIGEGVGAALKGIGTAAKAGSVEANATALIGPAGDASASATKQIPKGWDMKTSNNGQGTIFMDPVNPAGNNVRVQGGNPNSPNPAQRNPYVKQTSNGRTVNVNKKQVSPKSPESHIPKKDFKF